MQLRTTTAPPYGTAAHTTCSALARPAVHVTLPPETLDILEATKPSGQTRSSWMALLIQLGAAEWQRTHGKATSQG